MNEYRNPDLCQTCAKCCKEYSFYWSDPDSVLRMSWLAIPGIKVEYVEGASCRITLPIPCSKLRKGDGKYLCTEYDKMRPTFCRTFPLNVIGDERDGMLEHWDCPALDELLQERATQEAT